MGRGQGPHLHEQDFGRHQTLCVCVFFFSAAAAAPRATHATTRPRALLRMSQPDCTQLSQPDCTQLSQPDCTQLSQCTQRCADDDDDSEGDGGGGDDVAPARLVRLVDGSPGTAVTVPPEGEGALSVGRTEQLGSCTLLLDDNAVSKRHAELRFNQGSLELRVTSSNVFTFVNESAHIALAGKPPPPPVSLCDGDVLRFGGGRQSSTRCDKFIFRVDVPQCKRAEGTVCLSPLPARASSAASSASAGETPLAEWFWQIGKGASRAWSRYAPHQEALIERAYQLAEERVRLDGERVLDLRQMKQVNL